MKSLVLILSLCAVASCINIDRLLPIDIFEDPLSNNTINPGNGVDRGDWGEPEFCSSNSFASKMDLKYEPRGNVDDTCANALSLSCYDTSGLFWNNITSSEGKEGTYQGIRSCPEGEFIIGFAMRVEGLVGNFDDDIAVVDVRVECQGGDILDGLRGVSKQSENKLKNHKDSSQVNKKEIGGDAVPLIHKLTPEEIQRHHQLRGNGEDQTLENTVRRNIYKLTPQDKERHRLKNRKSRAGEDGEWGPIVTCPSGQLVCGIRTRVEPTHLYDDDAGLCDIVLYCCE